MDFGIQYMWLLDACAVRSVVATECTEIHMSIVHPIFARVYEIDIEIRKYRHTTQSAPKRTF